MRLPIVGGGNLFDAPHEWVNAMAWTIISDRAAVSQASATSSKNPSTLSFVQG